jgi:hypothetical protein
MVVPVAAIVALVTTAASIASSAAMAKKAADAKTDLKSTSSGEQSMLSIQRMKATDLAGQSGLSAGQYSRALMDNEASAVQAEGIVNKMSENPFADAYKNQAFAKFTISQIISAKEKARLSLVDMDAEAAARNAINASNIAGQAADTEGKILARENEIKQMELQKKTQLFENVGRIVASGAKAIGTTVAYGQEAGWFDSKAVSAAKTQESLYNATPIEAVKQYEDVAKSPFKAVSLNDIMEMGGDNKVGVPNNGLTETRLGGNQPLDYKNMNLSQWLAANDLYADY